MGRDANLYQILVTKLGEARREMTYFGEATVNARWSAFDTQGIPPLQMALLPVQASRSPPEAILGDLDGYLPCLCLISMISMMDMGMSGPLAA